MPLSWEHDHSPCVKLAPTDGRPGRPQGDIRDPGLALPEATRKILRGQVPLLEDLAQTQRAPRRLNAAMCGRFTLTQPAYIAAKFGLDNFAPVEPKFYEPRFNVAPTSPELVEPISE
jgi:hypothetical protein